MKQVTRRVLYSERRISMEDMGVLNSQPSQMGKTLLSPKQIKPHNLCFGPKLSNLPPYVH